MRKHLLTYICGIVLFFLCTLSNVYAQQINLKKINLKNAVPSTSVQRVFQDKEGYLWLGTIDGLCRYDGYKTLVFRSDFSNPNLLTNNNITSIAEDAQNNIWIGTKSGINILNKENYQIHALNIEEISNRPISSIIVSRDSLIWVGVGNFVYCFYSNAKLKNKYEVVHHYTNINTIYEDWYGDIWVGLWEGGLFRFNDSNSTFESFPPIGKGNNPFRIYQDKQKRYWVGTWGDGLFLFEPQSNISSMYTPVKAANKTDACFGIVQDDYYGYIWAMTYSGMIILDAADNDHIELINAKNIFKDANNIFSEMLKDKNGQIWIGAFGDGLLNLNIGYTPVINYKLEDIKEKFDLKPKIETVFEDHEGDIWFRQDRFGWGIYYPKNKETKFYTNFPSLKDKAGLINLKCALNINNSNIIWLGGLTDANIYIVKKSNSDIQLIKNIDLSEIDTAPGYPTVLFQDSRNNIWIGTTESLFILPYGQEKIKLVKSSIGEINSITEDIKGGIWIGAFTSGLLYIPFKLNLNIEKIEIEDYSTLHANEIDSNHIQSVVADKDGRIWIGTREGRVIMYNNRDNIFTDYTVQCGLKGNTIFDIVVDNFGNVWISTQLDLIEFNPTNEALFIHNSSDMMLINSFMKGSFYKSKISNYIYWGGNQGISRIETSERISKPSSNPKTLITDIKIGGRSVLNSNENSKFNPITNILELNPEDKNIEIDFSSLNYIYSENVHFKYKLEGVDDDWVYPGNDRQFATYNQLKKGSYRFLIKSSDENRIWSDQITVLTIVKHPAFYETWWAYTLYCLIASLIVLGLFRFYINRINLKNELKIAQIEKEKAEELTQTKLRYFTNVSHDFLTPLTIISCMIDDIEITIKEKIPQFETMRANVNRLQRLLQQILDFRKVENSSMKLRISRGDISLFIKDICHNHFTPLIKKNNIDFKFSSEPFQILAYFDADKIDKIVFNLLSNAFKYTQEGGTIGIYIQSIDEDGQSNLLLKVYDTGIGISPKDINNIFTRFYHNRNTDLARTNGIGLSLTKDLVELHKGTIIVESELNIGTTFTVKLPIDDISYDEADIIVTKEIITEESSIADNYISEDTTNTIRLLLVEDNEELLNTVGGILSKHYSVIKAKNGLEALLAVQNNPIDIIVSDVMMPEMDGLELCEKIKGDIETSHIPILLLTAKNSTEDRIECYNAGADGYISKPFDIKLLEARVNNFLSNKKKQQQEFKTDTEINISTLKYTSIDEEFLKNVMQLIEENLSESEFDNDAFAQHLNISKATLYRKIKTITGLSPIELIKNIRMKHASQMLKDKSLTVAEVAYATGFTDPKHFSYMFKAEFNMSPSEYKKNIE